MSRSNPYECVSSPYEGCGEKFGSKRAFDGHRVGEHDHTLTEGLRMNPSLEDGRRCLSVDEMQAKGWMQDELGVWIIHKWDSEAKERTARSVAR